VLRILALDAATEACSVSLWCDGAQAGRSSESGKSGAAQILAMVEEILAEAQLSLSSLNAIACSIGPGAFTGVRISVAVAQGLAFGADLAVIPVTTLEAIAYYALAPGGPVSRVLACLDARMGEVYWGCFAADALQGVSATSAPAVSAPQNVVLPDSGRFLAIGRGLAAYPALAVLPGIETSDQFKHCLPNAREMAQLAALRSPLGAGMDPALLTPLYLRDKVAFTTAERAARSQ
jgi:tRNA threonylcarbamoyladenosine biosynthesis protein TsaB